MQGGGGGGGAQLVREIPWSAADANAGKSNHSEGFAGPGAIKLLKRSMIGGTYA